MSSPFFHPNFNLPTLDENSLNPIFPSPNPHDFSRFEMIGRCSISSGNAEASDDLSDETSQLGEKKRRLNMEQVRTLEINFELGNKLEPERKIQLAKSLGLHPRQIAIWFQNRRARWKTKQLEKDFELLRRKFDAIKADNDSLQSQNKKLQDEILQIKGMEVTEMINLNKETEKSSSNSSEENIEQLNPIQSLTLFPAVSPPSPPPAISQLLNGEENLGNFLCGMEDQSIFWPWADQQNFH